MCIPFLAIYLIKKTQKTVLPFILVLVFLIYLKKLLLRTIEKTNYFVVMYYNLRSFFSWVLLFYGTYKFYYKGDFVAFASYIETCICLSCLELLCSLSFKLYFKGISLASILDTETCTPIAHHWNYSSHNQQWRMLCLGYWVYLFFVRAFLAFFLVSF